jgi:hypothetical protein
MYSKHMFFDNNKKHGCFPLHEDLNLQFTWVLFNSDFSLSVSFKNYPEIILWQVLLEFYSQTHIVMIFFIIFTQFCDLRFLAQIKNWRSQTTVLYKIIVFVRIQNCLQSKKFEFMKKNHSKLSWPSVLFFV